MKKKELREKYKKQRLDLSNQDLQARSQLIVKHLFQNFDLTGKKISCFIPIVRFNEVNTWLIIDHVSADFYLPVLRDSNQLKHVYYEGKHTLKESAWGILEPTTGAEINPAELDVVLAPLLTIDSNGYRVGYGKGYYDAFLKACRSDCIFIGLYQFETLETIEDLHEADIPLHACITPQGLIRFNDGSLNNRVL